MGQPVTDPKTQQALAELVHCAAKQMEWEAGFIVRYKNQIESLEFVKMMSCSEITIAAHEQALAAYRTLAEHLRIDLPSHE